MNRPMDQLLAGLADAAARDVPFVVHPAEAQRLVELHDALEASRVARSFDREQLERLRQWQWEAVAELRDIRAQWGDDPLWSKHRHDEDVDRLLREASS